MENFWLLLLKRYKVRIGLVLIMGFGGLLGMKYYTSEEALTGAGDLPSPHQELTPEVQEKYRTQVEWCMGFESTDFDDRGRRISRDTFEVHVPDRSRVTITAWDIKPDVLRRYNIIGRSSLDNVTVPGSGRSFNVFCNIPTLRRALLAQR